ncbi:MAG TPA: hypothetical protein DCY95_11570 [Algoriphagus sp.]|nr:hypothetical protein [Algoriphagus sp.]HAZ25169.1 hypothetical protein [Algoriphagus sp.]HCX74828.1 hypothetical protein [Algoriphagus sp.]
MIDTGVLENGNICLNSVSPKSECHSRLQRVQSFRL